MIVPTARQIGIQSTQRHSAADAHDARREDGTQTFRVERVRRAAPRTERRSSESMANAAALRLGIAAQMLASHEGMDDGVLVLPTHPAMRSAAHYASTAEGLAPTATLGFSRTA
ncbi:MAG: hypothetical protein JJ908_12705 [Rhizobiales bacterium]|nr:hypothetical protein [Hyphomicrobiales bacterium]MBO6699684.1 hypothetical protein [Hyphomicrobiales bacterium]MBO6737222.1 hypothetical protein [Hyphomicrobiales bacterium]MBO6911704.1 hypothetical protein [Hyphomicrobiales bacterium]MBO6954874.1 hypothetical protein [Hyphomicrobiales bacterium]